MPKLWSKWKTKKKYIIFGKAKISYFLFYWKNELTIENISNTNIHHESITSSPIYSIIQLDSGVVAIGLENGIINFYHQDNFEVPYFNIRVDIYPIFSILQIKAPQLLCSSGSSMYLIYESESKKFTYEKVKKMEG